MNSWKVYIIECTDKTLYTGITNDMKKRLAAHNAGTASKYTRARLPVKLRYTENCSGRPSASKREAVIKKLSRANKLALIKHGVQKI